MQKFFLSHSRHLVRFFRSVFLLSGFRRGIHPVCGDRWCLGLHSEQMPDHEQHPECWYAFLIWIHECLLIRPLVHAKKVARRLAVDRLLSHWENARRAKKCCRCMRSYSRSHNCQHSSQARRQVRDCPFELFQRVVQRRLDRR